MSSSQSQRSYMNLIAGMAKPDVEQAALMLDHAKNENLPPRMIEGIETFIDRQKHAATLDRRAKEAKDASSGAWGNVREMAKRTDDLVDMVEDRQLAEDGEPPSEDRVRGAVAFLTDSYPLAASWFNSASETWRLEPLTGVVVTSNDEDTLSLLVLFQSAVALIKHGFQDVFTDEINVLLDEWMQRCHDKVALAQQTLTQATKTCGFNPRQILKEVSPLSLDILDGSVDIAHVETEELSFAHRCWAYWDSSLATAAHGSAIAAEIKGRPAKPAPPAEADFIDQGAETRAVDELMGAGKGAKA